MWKVAGGFTIREMENDVFVFFLGMRRRGGEFLRWNHGYLINICGSFLHVRVLIDVSKPIRKVVPVLVSTNGTTHRAELKFERIPDFCYVCGRIGHITTKCLEPVANEMIELGNFQYGDWLKAASFFFFFSGNSYGDVGNVKRRGGHPRLVSDANRNLRGRYHRDEDYGGAPRSDSSGAKGIFQPKPPERNQRHSETVSIDVESDLPDGSKQARKKVIVVAKVSNRTDNNIDAGTVKLKNQGIPNSSDRPYATMDDFREVMEECDLYYLGFEGCWRNRFPSHRVYHLDFFGLEHRAILLKLVDSVRAGQGPKKHRRFIFEPMWMTDGSFNEMLRAILVA
ncbi:hypothetical protein TIFTF001_026061 [Ficus carica]|uniref:CCHC-type domain-containing protein n=1 Tax=Ficus carica TaxID=3494 RepID=A0AA88AZD6_FICCA|nr:hypothetical protein TIFTF001_026061 [Ficus carica]